MASPGELVRTVATALGVPESSVVVHDRLLAASGLRTKGGRGRSAAKVSAKDAMHLLIAVAGSGFHHAKINDAGAIVRTFVHLEAAWPEYTLISDEGGRDYHCSEPGAWRLERFPLAPLKHLPPNHHFADALLALIEAAADGSLHKAAIDGQAGVPEKRFLYFLKVHVMGPHPHAMIEIETSNYHEIMHYGPDNTDPHADLNQYSTFGDRTIFAVANLTKS